MPARFRFLSDDVLTHCAGPDCLDWSWGGPCACECVGCVVAKRAFQGQVGGRARCLGGEMEEIAHSLRAVTLGPNDVAVLRFPDKLTPDQRKKVERMCRDELDLARNRVLILEEGADMSTAVEVLQEQAALLRDAERTLMALTGAMQHLRKHPDVEVAARDGRVIAYAHGTVDLIRQWFAEGTHPDGERQDDAALAEG